MCLSQSILDPFFTILSMYARLIFSLYGVSRNALGQMAGAIPQAVTVTPEEREAIERVSYLVIL